MLCNNFTDLEQFRVFVESVFYIGKGKNSRSSEHLKDAIKCGRSTHSKVVIPVLRIREGS